MILFNSQWSYLTRTLTSQKAFFLMQNNHITGQAGDLCNSHHVKTFISDCSSTYTDGPKFDCPCCTRCCPDPQCKSADWWENMLKSVNFHNEEDEQNKLVPKDQTGV
mmetsp:Transcript_22065/g.33346  ORF Transcript_22065/g.33346 Transcript_22065/m.33346 type:complete len:107 (+) Transcript_22065:1111-1431(+)